MGVAHLLQTYPYLRNRASDYGSCGYIDLAIDVEKAWSSVPPFYRHILYELFVYGTDADTLVAEMNIPQPNLYSLVNEGMNLLRDDLNGYTSDFVPQEVAS